MSVRINGMEISLGRLAEVAEDEFGPVDLGSYESVFAFAERLDKIGSMYEPTPGEDEYGKRVEALLAEQRDPSAIVAGRGYRLKSTGAALVAVGAYPSGHGDNWVFYCDGGALKVYGPSVVEAV